MGFSSVIIWNVLISNDTSGYLDQLGQWIGIQLLRCMPLSKSPHSVPRYMIVCSVNTDTNAWLGKSNMVLSRMKSLSLLCWKMVIVYHPKNFHWSITKHTSYNSKPSFLNHSHRRSCFLTRNRLVGTHLGSCAVDQTSTPLPPLGRQLFLQRGGNLAVVLSMAGGDWRTEKWCPHGFNFLKFWYFDPKPRIHGFLVRYLSSKKKNFSKSCCGPGSSGGRKTDPEVPKAWDVTNCLRQRPFSD